MFSLEIKSQYPELYDDLTRIEECDLKYEERFYSKLESQKERPQRLLGHNASALIQKLLTRSRYLFQGFIRSFNDGNATVGFLSVRSHYETTGALACLLKWLQKFYGSKCTYEELDKMLYRLFMGGRFFPDKTIPKYSHAPDSVNVLSLIDDVDTLFKQMGGTTDKPFRKNYEYLSEFCHPNFLGISQGSKAIMPEGVYEFQYPPMIKNSEAKELLYNLFLSISMFINFFDKCYELLNKHEEMPILKNRKQT